jgi:glycerol kinase
MPELLLGLDVGTTTVTACLFAPGGERLSQAGARVTTTTPAPGRVEQDAQRIWRMARLVIRRALADAGRGAADLAAIGVTSQRTSLVLWDRASGQPLTPLVVWSDLRGAARANELQGAGFGVVAQQAAAKLEGLWTGLPDRAQLLAQRRLAWGNIDSFLIWKLSGGAAHVTDRSQAWPTGYLDLGTFNWNPALIAHQGLDESAFPTLVDTWGEMARTHRAGFGAAIPIAADIADQQAALVGQDAEAPGACKITFGTSATVDVSTGSQFVYGGPTIPPFVMASVGGETRFCIEGMVYSAGSALDWLRRSFRLGGHGRFEAIAAATPDSGDVFMLPALQGLGAPHGDLARRGLVGGLTLATGPGEIARAGLEGVAFRVREVVDHIYAQSGLSRPDVLRADGGLTNSDVLMQAQADILGAPLARHALREATACGAAICAGRGVGLLSPSDTAGFARYDRMFTPQISADESAARLAAWRRQVYGD